MKIRTGFVSNSSSSSFIIGLAKTDNGEYTFDINDIRGCKCLNAEVITTPTYDDIIVEFVGDGKYKLTYESFTYETVSCTVEDGDRFTFLNGTGPNDDSFFYEDEDDYDCNYDKIELSDFDQDDIVKYKEIQKLGGEVSFGAGRDG